MGHLCHIMPVPTGVTSSSYVPDFIGVVAVLPGVSCIDFTKKENNLNIPSDKPFQGKKSQVYILML